MKKRIAYMLSVLWLLTLAACVTTNPKPQPERIPEQILWDSAWNLGKEVRGAENLHGFTLAYEGSLFFVSARKGSGEVRNLYIQNLRTGKIFVDIGNDGFKIDEWDTVQKPKVNAGVLTMEECPLTEKDLVFLGKFLEDAKI
jgi:hypothetical protein